MLLNLTMLANWQVTELFPLRWVVEGLCWRPHICNTDAHEHMYPR
jgi:hypothetical protein